MSLGPVESWSRIPRLNHVAMSVPAERLDAEGREAILRFYGEVFGMTEMPTLTVDRERLVLRVHDNEQFVFLTAEADPMRCPRGDHFGLSVGSPEELDAILERARAWQERDPRVEIDEPEIDDFGVLRLHSFYLRFLLPLRIEVQCFEWQRGVDSRSLPGA